MATNTALRSSIAHNPHSLLPKHRHDHIAFLKPTAPPKPSAISAISAAVRTSAAASTSSAAAASDVALDALGSHLAAGEFRAADEETRRLLIALAGEAAVRRGYVFFSEVQYIPADALRRADELWRRHSGGRFGYSVQKRIFEGKAAKDFTRFFIRVGWMKKLDTEVVQYNYRSFPAEFLWELDADTPEGHLPLTNALRGTQLLNSIFNHPAFDDVVSDPIAQGLNQTAAGSGAGSAKTGNKPSTGFKTDYSF